VRKSYYFTIRLLFVFGLLVSGQVYAGKPSGSAYLDGGDSTFGMILCHGRGHHPTWDVVDPLRKGVHEQLGYHTLSLQMPAEKKNWKKYAADFPEAYDTIQQGIDYLRNEKGVTTIYLMGHSMGSRMATAFLANHPEAKIDGFIGVGIRNGGDDPLNSNMNLRSVSIPVVDIYGDGGDGKDAKHAEYRSDMVSDRYEQIFIPGADHRFNGDEDEMVSAVVNWLKSQASGG
jgi:dienelactone hydrolase